MARMWELAPSRAGVVLHLADRGEQALSLLGEVPEPVEVPRQPTWSFDGHEINLLEARFQQFGGQFVGEVKKRIGKVD